MKKKLLLLILLLLPFIVKANELDNLSLKWTFGEKKEDFVSYEFEHTFVLSSENELTSINKISGETKKVSFNSGSHAKLTNPEKIALVTQDNNKVSLIEYDEYLNQISKKSFENFEVDAFYIDFNEENGFYYIISGNKYVDGDYYRIVIEYSETLGEKKYEFKTYQKTSPYYSSSVGLKFFMDFNGNIYIPYAGAITPYYINNDGSYMYLTNDKLYKKSTTGEDIASIDIPSNNGARIAKKDDYYYIMTNIYSQDQNDPNKYNLSFKFYIIDEDLNIIQTINSNLTKGIYDKPTEQGFDIEIFNIYYYNTFETQFNIEDDYYQINPDGDITPLERSSIPYYKEHYYISNNGGYRFQRQGKYYYGSDIQNLVREEEYFLDYEAYINNETITALVQLKKEESENNKYVKYRLITYDRNLNVLYKKDLTDWEEPNPSEGGYFFTGDVEFKDNYTIVALNYKDKVLLLVLDAEGNIIKDLSNEVAKTKHMNVTGILTTYKGFFIKYDSGYFAIDHMRGVSQVVNAQTLVKSKTIILLQSYIIPNGTWDRDNEYYNELENYTYLFAFSYNFNVIKQVNGKGTITTTVEKADEGEVVRFTVTPEEGYVLSMVKVTDANGNVLTFTDNTFVMPSSDVIIEATFVPKNPKTSDIAILAICLITLSSFIIFALEKRRLNTLK